MIYTRSTLWLLALVPACFHPSYDHPACGPGGACPSGLSCSAAGFCEATGTALDASAGDPDGGASVHVCLGTFVNVCVDTPQASLSLMTGTIDTSDASSSSKCLPSTAYTMTPLVDACVIAAQTITIPANNKVSVTGIKRLILLANDTLTIGGTLDAASHRGGLSGPAADIGLCPTNFTDPTTVGQGGGGWGGTLGQPGNDGGNTPGGGLGGIAGSALTITTFGGGCAGGNGASGNGGSHGRGGGAVLLLAGQSVSIAGVVNASGAAGSGGKASNASAGAGGGGGGSGGMIVLEAPIVGIPGKCFANGGGGGEGSTVLAGSDGGESSAPDKPGGGGNNGSPIGGDGGSGGAGATGSSPGEPGGTITNPVVDSGGGGGGGGGVGIIKIISGNQDNNFHDLTKVSPPPS